MSGNIDVMATAALAVSVLMILAWILSLVVGNAGIVDVLWGIGFALIASTSALIGDGDSSRSDLLVAMVVVWGFRLSLHIWWQDRGRGEREPYRSMRRRAGDRFAVSSLAKVFLVRGLIMWVLSLPLQLATTQESPDVGFVAVVGVALWGAGFFFGSVGDSQLARFRSAPENQGTLLDSGLWRYTRHPNRFGDFCAWWGVFLVAAEATDPRFAVFSPIIMTIMLVRFPGSTTTERSLSQRMPGYNEYIQRTPMFFPRPPIETS